MSGISACPKTPAAKQDRMPFFEGITEQARREMMGHLPAEVKDALCVEKRSAKEDVFITAAGWDAYLRWASAAIGNRGGVSPSSIFAGDGRTGAVRAAVAAPAAAAPTPYEPRDDVWKEVRLGGAGFTDGVERFLKPWEMPAAYDPSDDERTWIQRTLNIGETKWRQLEMRLPPRFIAQVRAALGDSADQLFRSGLGDGQYFVTRDEEGIRRIVLAVGAVKTHLIPNPNEVQGAGKMAALFGTGAERPMTAEQKFWDGVYAMLKYGDALEMPREGLGESTKIGIGFAIGAAIVEALKHGPAVVRLLRDRIRGPRPPLGGGGEGGADADAGAEGGTAADGVVAMSALAGAVLAIRTALDGAIRLSEKAPRRYPPRPIESGRLEQDWMDEVAMGVLSGIAAGGVALVRGAAVFAAESAWPAVSAVMDGAGAAFAMFAAAFE